MEYVYADTMLFLVCPKTGKQGRRKEMCRVCGHLKPAKYFAQWECELKADKKYVYMPNTDGFK